MLFRKKTPSSCTYCLYGTRLDDCNYLCVKRGVVNADKACRKFCYDPCKRIPPKQKASDFTKYDQEDFSL